MAFSLRFVVVEKDSELRSLYTRRLRTGFAGCAVSESESGTAALELLSLQRVDVVIVNQRAADLEGVALISGIRRQHPALPLIAIGEAPLRADALEAGATAFLEANRWRDLTQAVQQVLTAGRPPA
jgi:DNA-binding NtrC family response regulator